MTVKNEFQLVNDGIMEFENIPDFDDVWVIENAPEHLTIPQTFNDVIVPQAAEDEPQPAKDRLLEQSLERIFENEPPSVFKPASSWTRAIPVADLEHVEPPR